VARAASAHALSASRRPPPPPSFVAARHECLPAPPGLDWRAYRAGTAPHCRIVQSAVVGEAAAALFPSTGCFDFYRLCRLFLFFTAVVMQARRGVQRLTAQCGRRRRGCVGADRRQARGEGP
jgi:hypothetical protein